MTKPRFDTTGLWPEIAAIVESDKLFSKLPTSLLSVSADAKTVKGEAGGVLTGILYLSPADTVSKKTLCPYAGLAGCQTDCLNTAGRGAFSNVQRARVRKTLFWQQYPREFMALLVADIKRLQRKAARLGMTPAVRLNGTSDIRWEKIGDGIIFDVFPEIQFYDYTKIPCRTVPANYHLTFSFSGRPVFQKAVWKQIDHDPDMNIAAVFSDHLPAEFLGRTVLDGDRSDVRFNDTSGAIVGLIAKGRAKTSTSGFVYRNSTGA